MRFSLRFDYEQWQPSGAKLKTSPPVTEVVLHYFASPVDQDQRDQVAADALAFTVALSDESLQIQTFTSGWQLPGDPGVSHEDSQQESAVMFIKLLGWPSLEEHGKVRSTEAWQKQLPNLKLGAKGGEMKHVIFRRL